MEREPCPWRIIDDIGGAFAMGSVGGAIFHSIKGARNSPSGARISGALTAVKARSPVLGGNFAVWGALFSVFDCSLAAVRHKEDPWNSILAGAATGATLAMRAGWKAALRNGVIGGVLLAFIEGLGVALNSWVAEQQRKVQFEQGQGLFVSIAPPPAEVTAPSAYDADTGAFLLTQHADAEEEEDELLEDNHEDWGGSTHPALR